MSGRHLPHVNPGIRPRDSAPSPPKSAAELRYEEQMAEWAVRDGPPPDDENATGLGAGLPAREGPKSASIEAAVPADIRDERRGIWTPAPTGPSVGAIAEAQQGATDAAPSDAAAPATGSGDSGLSPERLKAAAGPRSAAAEPFDVVQGSKQEAAMAMAEREANAAIVANEYNAAAAVATSGDAGLGPGFATNRGSHKDEVAEPSSGKSTVPGVGGMEIDAHS